MPNVSEQISTEQISAEIERCDEVEATLREAIATMRDPGITQYDHRMTAIGVLDQNGFEAAVRNEAERNRRTGDTLAIVELALTVAEDEELRLLEQLDNVATRAGDKIGKIGEGRYALLLPWSDAQEAAEIEKVCVGMATYAVPNAEKILAGSYTIDTMPTATRPMLRLVDRTPQRAMRQASPIGRTR